MSILGFVQRLGRAVLEALVRVVFWPGRAVPIEREQIRKVLVVRIDTRVGNLLLTTPLLRALKSGLPEARIDLLLAAGKESLVAGLPFVDRVIAFRKQDFFVAPWKLWRLLRSLRAEHYDVAIEAGHFHAFSFTSSALARFSGARIRIGHRRGLSERFLTHAVEHLPAHVNDVEARLELLGPLSVAPGSVELETRLGREGPKVLALLTEKLPKNRFVALNIGARKPDHRWEPERFGELAARLKERGLVPLVLWGPGEQTLAEQVRTSSRDTAVIGPPTDLEELAATFRVASVVVANDTGPMHLANAVGARLVCCFLAEDAERWAHPGENFIGVRVREVQDPVGEVERAVLKLLPPVVETA